MNTESKAVDSVDAAGAVMPPTTAEEAELLQSLDTIVQQARQGTGDCPSVTCAIE